MPGRADHNDREPTGQEPAAPFVPLVEAAAATGQHPEALRAKVCRGSVPAIRSNDGGWLVQLPAASRPGGRHRPGAGRGRAGRRPAPRPRCCAR